MVDRNPGILRHIKEIATDIAEADSSGGDSNNSKPLIKETPRVKLFGRKPNEEGRHHVKPKKHTRMSVKLGLERIRHPLRGRGHTVGDYHMGSEMVPTEDGKELRVRLPQPKPELSPRVHAEHSVDGHVSPNDPATQPEFRRTRSVPFVVSDQAPAPVTLFQAHSRES